MATAPLDRAIRIAPLQHFVWNIRWPNRTVAATGATLGKCEKTPGAPQNGRGDCPAKDPRLTRPQNPNGAARSVSPQKRSRLDVVRPNSTRKVMASDGDCALRSAIRNRFVPPLCLGSKGSYAGKQGEP